MNGITGLDVVLEKLKETIDFGVEGDVVEFGCWNGGTSLLMQKVIKNSNCDKTFHVYDSFEGLPQNHEKDGNNLKEYLPGFLKTPKENLISLFNHNHLELPIIHVGWFKDAEVPDKISFAFFDGDYYTSIIDSFEKVYPKLSKNAIVLVHDYTWEVLPGARAACDDFFKDKPEKVICLDGKNLGMVIKL